MRSPEEIQALLIQEFGEKLGQTVWLFLDDELAGHRIYWARRAGRRLVELSIYTRIGQGRTAEGIAAAEGITVRSVRRIVRRVRHRHGKAA